MRGFGLGVYSSSAWGKGTVVINKCIIWARVCKRGVVLVFKVIGFISPRKFCELSSRSLSVGVSPIGTDKIAEGRIVNHPGAWSEPNQISSLHDWELRNNGHNCEELVILEYCIVYLKPKQYYLECLSNFTDKHRNELTSCFIIIFKLLPDLTRKRLCIFIITSIYDHIIKRRQARVFATFNTSKTPAAICCSETPKAQIHIKLPPSNAPSTVYKSMNKDVVSSKHLKHPGHSFGYRYHRSAHGSSSCSS